MSLRKRRPSLELLNVAAQVQGIRFHDTLPEEQWPDAHSNHFKTVRKLGRCIYEAADDDNVNLQSGLSATHMKRRARRIREAAESLLSQRANETEWRIALEDEILARFKYEVTCKTCRRRLWRSREQVDITALSSGAQRGIERVRQQRARHPCQCSEAQRDTDETEIGLNEIFSSRAGRKVELDLDYGKKQPDRLIGLRKTANFDHALTRVHNTRKNVIVSPFKGAANDDADVMLLPFLVLEAKSSEAKEEFDEIEIQTAFPIRNLLKLQEDLRVQSENFERSGSPPLVWFLANKGFQWQIYGCWTETPMCGAEENDRDTYHAARIWSGDIIADDEALQLLLIVDHIFDWARELYRGEVLRQLRALGPDIGDDTRSQSDLFTDYNNANIRAPESFMADDDIVEEVKLLEALDSSDDAEHGCFRHAAYIETRIFGLVISKNDVQSFLGSIQRPEEWCRSILNTFSAEMMILNSRELWEVERTWMNEEPDYHVNDRTEEFYVRLMYQTYLDANWYQIRELTYFAVSSEALSILVQRSGLPRPAEESYLRPQTGSLSQRIRILRSASLHFNLRAAISRTSMMFGFDKSGDPESSRTTANGDSRAQLIQSGALERPSVCLYNTSFDEARAGRYQGLYRTVHEVIQEHTTGNKVANEPYIRYFCKLERQDQKEANEGSMPFEPAGPLFISRLRQSFSLSGFVVVASKLMAYNDRGLHSHDGICIYQVDGEPHFPDAELLSTRLCEFHQTNRKIHLSYRYGIGLKVDPKMWNFGFEKLCYTQARNGSPVEVNTVFARPNWLHFVSLATRNWIMDLRWMAKPEIYEGPGGYKRRKDDLDDFTFGAQQKRAFPFFDSKKARKPRTQEVIDLTGSGTPSVPIARDQLKSYYRYFEEQSPAYATVPGSEDNRHAHYGLRFDPRNVYPKTRREALYQYQKAVRTRSRVFREEQGAEH